MFRCVSAGGRVSFALLTGLLLADVGSRAQAGSTAARVTVQVTVTAPWQPVALANLSPDLFDLSPHLDNAAPVWVADVPFKVEVSMPPSSATGSASAVQAGTTPIPDGSSSDVAAVDASSGGRSGGGSGATQSTVERPGAGRPGANVTGSRSDAEMAFVAGNAGAGGRGGAQGPANKIKDGPLKGAMIVTIVY